ncbi:MAG: manganese catalase family protein [Agathobacter sp.]|nr:manganese catalase family protein [Agathobacter sp.]
MWLYEKRLEYPVNITQPNAKMASFIISQYGGPDGEMGASMRYLSQRYSMENRKVAGLLTDIGTEELAHLEMVATIVRQLTKGLSAKELEDAGFAPYYIDHTAAVWPQAAGGIPFNACEFQSKGDTITDLFEDMAAEQKARTTYDNILRLVKDQEVADPIRFLREREIVHFQRFGEGLRMICDELDSKNYYMCNAQFDKGCGNKGNCNCG